MPPFTITPCNIDDGPALAYNNISAFWTDPTWVLLWRGKTLEYVIAQSARRQPYNLLANRARFRHEKVVDVNSNIVVGYARWILPEANTIATADLDSLWSAAQVPTVSPEREREAKNEYEMADWSFDHALDELDPPMLEIKDRLMRQKNYLVLDYLAVHPDYRGQGIATLLVESGIQEAQKMGLDIFVVAMKAALGVYKRAGFKLLDQIIQDDSKFGGKGEWGVYYLVREVEK